MTDRDTYGPTHCIYVPLLHRATATGAGSLRSVEGRENYGGHSKSFRWEKESVRDVSEINDYLYATMQPLRENAKALSGIIFGENK